MTSINDMSLRDAIYGLRATRIFDGTPIEPKVLDQILEAATMACSSGNTQPWEFVVVTSDELKAKIKAEMIIGFEPVDADRYRTPRIWSMVLVAPLPGTLRSRTSRRSARSWWCAGTPNAVFGFVASTRSSPTARWYRPARSRAAAASRSSRRVRT